MTGKFAPWVLQLGSAALIVTAIAAGRIDRASAGPPASREAAPVEVVNTEADAVPVSVTVQEPVQFAGFDRCPTSGFGCGFSFFTVPSGKRLVIEFVSMIISDVEQSDKIAPRITTTAGGTGITHELGLASETTEVGGVSNVILSKSVKLYSDPGTDVSASFRRELAITEFGYGLTLTVSGYLETVP